MAQATKTFKIGEYAKGGVITVEVKGRIVIIIGKEWDFSTGSRKSSDQSNAKEFTRVAIDTMAHTDSMNSFAYRQMLEFLNDLTTSYYADQIIEWIETKVKLNKW